MASSTSEYKHDAASGTHTDGGGPLESLDEEGARVIELENSYTPEEEREVLRRIDRTILPMVGLLLTPVAVPLWS